MTSSLDLNLLPVARKSGQEFPELPDLYAVMPPRHPAHGREADSLVIYLSLSGNAPLPPPEHTQLLERLAQKFYKTSGSVTAALRTVAEGLNMYLLDRNRRSTGGGRQGIGLLVLGVLRADTFYMAHCGPVQVLLVGPKETRALHELASAGRGLGLSRTTPVRYVQARLADGDFLVLASQPSPGWTTTALHHPQRMGIEGMRRQLMEYAMADVNAVLISAQAGTGRLRFLHRKPVEQGMTHSAQSVPAVASTPAAQTAQAPRQPATPAPVRPSPAAPVTGMRRAGMEQPLEPGGATAPATATPAPRLGHSHPANRVPSRPKGTVLADLRAGASRFLQAAGQASSKLLIALARVLKKLLPDASTLRLPRGVMIFFALAVPLVLAIVGASVFIQRGRTQQYQVYYQEATALAAQAAPLTDPVEQRNIWKQVLEQLDKAEYYSVTADSQTLRSQANVILDGLDGTQRLEFHTAIIGGLGDTVRVTRMIARDNYLYMLNAAQGAVILGMQLPNGYEVSPNFQCGPMNEDISVGPLVDITEVPTSVAIEADLIGMDIHGNLVYCLLYGDPEAHALAHPPAGLGEPIALTIDQGNLYVLDPKANAVWVYYDLDIDSPPHFFFGNDVPPMQDVIDLAVYNDELYLLHSDGHLTHCTYSYLQEAPSPCQEPYPYTDSRSGREGEVRTLESLFSQVSYVAFPDRSMYMLDPQNQAAYYFSVQFKYITQYRPLTHLAEGQATAFAVSAERRIFLAISDSVFYAALP